MLGDVEKRHVDLKRNEIIPLMQKMQNEVENSPVGQPLSMSHPDMPMLLRP